MTEHLPHGILPCLGLSGLARHIPETSSSIRQRRCAILSTRLRKPIMSRWSVAGTWIYAKSQALSLAKNCVQAKSKLNLSVLADAQRLTQLA